LPLLQYAALRCILLSCLLPSLSTVNPKPLLSFPHCLPASRQARAAPLGSVPLVSFPRPSLSRLSSTASPTTWPPAVTTPPGLCSSSRPSRPILPLQCSPQVQHLPPRPGDRGQASVPLCWINRQPVINIVIQVHSIPLLPLSPLSPSPSLPLSSPPSTPLPTLHPPPS
jgi:hypothetical protein